MFIVQECKPRPEVEPGDLVVIKGTPYFVITRPMIALLDATNCNALANGTFNSLEDLNLSLANFDDVKIYSKENYHFKVERRRSK